MRVRNRLGHIALHEIGVQQVFVELEQVRLSRAIIRNMAMGELRKLERFGQYWFTLQRHRIETVSLAGKIY